MAGPIRIAILANGTQARAELERTGVAAGVMGKGFTRLGHVMAGAFAIDVLARGAGKLVHLSNVFESSMTRIQTQAGASASDVAKLSKSVLALGGKVQQSPEELANSLYHLKSVGLDNVKAMQALRASSKFAAVGNADLEETTNALAGTWRSGIRGAGSFNQAIATLNAVIGAGNMKMGDLNEAIGTGFLPSARSFGLSLKDVGSALALMTDEGIPANVAATRLRMTFSLLGAPSKVAATQLKKIGLSSKSLAVEMRKNGLVGAIGLLRDHLKGLSQVDQAQLLSHAFGGGRSSSAILTLINNFDVLEQKQRQINNTAGLSRFAKSVETQSKTAAAKIALFKSSLETLGTQVGKPLAGELANILTPLTTGFIGIEPKIVAFGHTISDDLGPAFSAVSKTVGDYVKALGGATSNGSLFLAALRPLGDVAKVVADGLDAIPGPLKTIGVEAGLAALVFPRLANGVTLATEAVVTQITSLRVLALELKTTGIAAQTSTIALGRLGAAASLAAGVGGMLLLVQGMKKADTEGQQFAHTADKVVGGALIGLSMRGPVGAAIGATAGLAASFGDLQGAFDKMLGNNNPGTIGHLISEGGDAAAKASTAIKGYRRSLLTLQATIDTISGKKTPDTRVKALTSFKSNYSAIYAQLKAAGVTDRALAFAVVGNKKATGLILRTLASNQGIGGINPHTQFASVLSAINDITLRTGVATRRMQDQISVTRHLTGLYKAFPKKVVSEIKISGIVPSLAGVKKVAEQYKVVGGKKLTALIKASGWEPTKKQVDALTRSLHNVAKVKPNVSPFLASLNTGIRSGQPRLNTVTQKVIAGAANSAKPLALKGGTGMGANMGQGAINGLNNKSGLLYTTAFSFVTHGLAGMRAGLNSHSPSRETMKLGVFMGQGLIIGLDSTHANLRLAGENAARQALSGMQTPALDLHRSLARQAKASGQQDRQVVEIRLDDGTALRGYVHKHARTVARDELDQHDAFWAGR